MITRKHLAILSAVGGAACYAVPDLPKRSLSLAESVIRTASAGGQQTGPNVAGIGGVPFPSTAAATDSHSPWGLTATLTPAVDPTASPGLAAAPNLAAPVQSIAPIRDTVRLGSLALAHWDERQLTNPIPTDGLIELIESLDAIALQGIAAFDDSFLQRITGMLAQRGRRFAYLADSGGGRPIELAILFDVDVLQVDRSWSYRVADPADVLTIDPLVGWFRTRGVAEERAWTFTFVVADLRRSADGGELRHLDAVRASIVEDGRGEDDFILAAWLDPTAGQLDSRWQCLTERADSEAGADSASKSGAVIAVPAGLTGEWTYRGERQRLVRRLNVYPEQAAAISPGDLVSGEFTATEHRY